MVETIALIFSYLIGNMRFAYLTTWLFSLTPPHLVGSKNPGATNVGRQSKLAGLLTFFLDALKVQIAYTTLNLLLGHEVAIWGTFFVVLGHMYPLDGYGGKGVACWLGCIFVLNSTYAIGVFSALLIAGLMSQMALASVFFVTMSIFQLPAELTALQSVVWQLIATLIIFSHRTNIQGMLQYIGRKST